MPRLLAFIGILVIACQLTLAGSGVLFLCLCVADEPHDTPCQPATVDAADRCAHEEREPVVEYHDCQDILIEGAELDGTAVEQASLLKAPNLMATLAPEPVFPLPGKTPIRRSPPRSPPLAATSATHYSTTVQLLL